MQGQLAALRDGDVARVFRFASPANRRAVGPVARFAELLGSPTYSPLLRHQAADLLRSVQLKPDTAVIIVGAWLCGWWLAVWCVACVWAVCVACVLPAGLCTAGAAWVTHAGRQAEPAPACLQRWMISCSCCWLLMAPPAMTCPQACAPTCPPASPA